MIYDANRRYTNANNTPTSDINEGNSTLLINLIDHQCVRGVLGWVGSADRPLLTISCNILVVFCCSSLLHYYSSVGCLGIV